MSTIGLGVNVSVELKDVLAQVNFSDIVDYYSAEFIMGYLSSHGPDFIDFTKIDETTYDKLVELINRKTLSLELLVGKVAVQNLMGAAKKVNFPTT